MWNSLKMRPLIPQLLKIEVNKSKKDQELRNHGKTSKRIGDTNIKDMNPSSENLDTLKVKEYASYLENAFNMNPEKAKIEALEIAIFNVAMNNKGKELNIFVSDDEAVLKAKEQRKLLQDPNNDGAKEALQYIQSLIEGLGITEEEYWNEYVINGYKDSILVEKLYANITKDSKDMDSAWLQFVDQTVQEFKKIVHKILIN